MIELRDNYKSKKHPRNIANIIIHNLFYDYLADKLIINENSF
ncbi:MAG: hypothetical protein PHY08_00840 [Candidatus Cloacimonetes bacterium]|nr:hypothetical protein [Candidatus Cloacimonadota bacterium]